MDMEEFIYEEEDENYPSEEIIGEFNTLLF